MNKFLNYNTKRSPQKIMRSCCNTTPSLLCFRHEAIYYSGWTVTERKYSSIVFSLKWTVKLNWYITLSCEEVRKHTTFSFQDYLQFHSMIRKPWHSIHWAVHIEKGSSQFFITSWVVSCQNLCLMLLVPISILKRIYNSYVLQKSLLDMD